MTVIHDLLDGPKTQLHIGGQWLAGSDQLDVIDPATEEVLTSVGLADRQQALAAVDAAAEAANSWASTPPRDRGRDPETFLRADARTRRAIGRACGA